MVTSIHSHFESGAQLPQYSDVSCASEGEDKTMISKRFMIQTLALMPVVVIFAAAGPGTRSASAAPLPAAYGQEPWEVPPGEFNDIQRRGYHDGVEGARKDYGNHRRPDVDNRDEYRNPDLPPDLREPYRFAFRRGYEMAASHLWGTPPPPPVAPPVVAPPSRDWDDRGARGLEGDSERQGYRDGAEAAHRDFEMQRRADPDDHESYRDPHVPPGLADEYREGFLRGYELSISQLSGQPVWQIRGEPGQWAPPPQFTEFQRQGFQDGADGARKDFGNHRHPNVLNRDEYRQPRVPQEFWREYREGFRRGYELAAARLWGGQ
jgi:hypothetical protein